MDFLDLAVCLNLLLCHSLVASDVALLCVIGSAFTSKINRAPGLSASSSGPVHAS